MKMHGIVAILCGLILFWCGPLMGVANPDSSASGQARAHIVVPLKVQSSTRLSFGWILSRKRGGAVIVTTDNQRFVRGNVKVIKHSRFHAAKFVITGAPNTSYNIQLADSTARNVSVKKKRKKKRHRTTLRIVDLKSFSKTVGAETTTGRIGRNGKDVVFVGGTLLVPPRAKNGRYKGRVNLTVSY